LAYLIDRPPARQQFYSTRNRALTGCTVLHDTESAFDEMGVDTGAENVAEFIRTRSTPGSYHDLVDSDSIVHLVPYQSGAFHDGTGSNNWALSVSFACRTSDWRRMTPAKRAGMLRNGALAFVSQQKWRKATGAPLTRLRYITKAQSDAGQSGFCCHGWRDPARRTDPGVAAPNVFPFDEFLAASAAALAELMPDHPDAGSPATTPDSPEDDAMLILCDYKPGQQLFGIYSGGVLTGLAGAERRGFDQQIAAGATHMWVHPATWDLMDRRGRMLVGEFDSPAQAKLVQALVEAIGDAPGAGIGGPA
jgi:hypothetical protein